MSRNIYTFSVTLGVTFITLLAAAAQRTGGHSRNLTKLGFPLWTLAKNLGIVLRTARTIKNPVAAAAQRTGGKWSRSITLLYGIRREPQRNPTHPRSRRTENWRAKKFPAIRNIVASGRADADKMTDEKKPPFGGFD